MGLRNLFRTVTRQPEVVDPNDVGDAGDLYTLELAGILTRLDIDDEDDTANFHIMEDIYDE